MANTPMGYAVYRDGRQKIILRNPTPISLFRNEIKKIKDKPVETPASVEK